MRRKVSRTTTVEEIETTCDNCLIEGRIKECPICKRDICSKCAILTEFTYLDEDVAGDYPNYFCKVCWKKGEDIRKQIFVIRETAEAEEQKLINDWRKL